jgi:hypothetical protein
MEDKKSLKTGSLEELAFDKDSLHKLAYVLVWNYQQVCQDGHPFLLYTSEPKYSEGLKILKAYLCAGFALKPPRPQRIQITSGPDGHSYSFDLGNQLEKGTMPAVIRPAPANGTAIYYTHAQFGNQVL